MCGTQGTYLLLLYNTLLYQSSNGVNGILCGAFVHQYGQVVRMAVSLYGRTQIDDSIVAVSLECRLNRPEPLLVGRFQHNVPFLIVVLGGRRKYRVQPFLQGPNDGRLGVDHHVGQSQFGNAPPVF